MALTEQLANREEAQTSNEDPLVPTDSKKENALKNQDAVFNQLAFKKLLALQIYDEELVASAPSRKNWKGMFIAIMVILAVIGLIVTAVFYMTPEDDGPRVKGTRISLEEVLSNEFRPRLFNGSWLQDDQLLTTDANNNFWVFDPENDSLEPLLVNISITVPSGAKYALSSDNRFLLLSTHHKKKPAQLEEFLITVYDLTSGMVYPIPLTAPDQRIYVQAFQWSPKGSALVYVHQNDLYLVADVTSGQIQRLTNDGAFNVIYNGIPDWTYQDILKGPMFWFSEAGDHLSYISINDTTLPEVNLPIYSDPDSFHLYTEKVMIRFPTPSSPIPKPNLRVIDLTEANPTSKDLRPPLSLRDQEYYLTSVHWVTNQRICAVWTVRAQNLSLISFCDAGPWHCQTVHTIETGIGGWLRLDAHLRFHTDGNVFIHLAPVKIDDDFFTNIVMVDTIKRHSWPVTRHPFEVFEILGWDVKRGLVFYAAAAQRQTAQRHLYKLQLNGQISDQDEVECLTCSVADRPSDDLGQVKWHRSIYLKEANIASFQSNNVSQNVTCQYSHAYLSPNLDYYVHECRGPSIPYVAVRSLEDNQLIRVLQSNDHLRKQLINKAYPRVIKLNVPLLMDNTPWARSKPDNISVELHLPPGLMEDETTVYPLVVWPADDPDSLTITDEWKVNWATYMASARDIIVAKIDVHGSQGKGHSIRNAIYRQPGVLEAVDLVQVTRVLQKTFPYISPVKTALLGSHYGGFLSIYTLAKDPSSVFGCSVAISPISSWKMMAAPYAERFLGPLNDQRDGQRAYFEADLTAFLKNLHTKYLFLIHGTLDDRVHVTHTFLIAKTMISNKYFFEQQLYPDAGLQDLKQNRQMYESIDKFINDCFDRRKLPEVDQTLHKGE